MTRMNRVHLAQLIALVLVFLLLMFSFGGQAWFSFTDRTAETDARPVEEPPILYIRDSDAQDMAQLDLTGLEIGKKKQIVFCVMSVRALTETPAYPNSTFSLELAYTQNLGADYTLYPATAVSEGTAGALHYISQDGNDGYFVAGGTPLSSVDATEQGNQTAYETSSYGAVQPNNQAVYQQYVYSETANDPNHSMQFVSPAAGTEENSISNTSKCRFFILSIDWPENAGAVDPKETDMVYVIAQGNRRQSA